MLSNPGGITQSLTLFHAYSTALHRETEPDGLLRSLVMRSVQLVRTATAGCFLYYNPNRETFYLRHTYGYSFPSLMEKIEVDGNTALLREMMQNIGTRATPMRSVEKEIAWLPAGQKPQYLEANNGELPVESILLPVSSPDRVLGVMVIERFGGDAFTEDETHLLDSFARQATLAIHKVQLYQENLRITRELDSELKSVGAVQTQLLPKRLPDIPQLEFFSHYQPATRAGGDYYDFIPLPDGRLAVLVADVTGHGAPAAVIAAMIKVILHTQFQQSTDPVQVLEAANGQIRSFIESQYFATVFLGIFDFSKNEVIYCSAGHEPPIHFSARTGELQEMRNESGYPLRLLEENTFDHKTLPYEGGDFFVLYSDGVTETFDESDDLFSFERLMQTVRDAEKQSAVSVGETVLKRLDEFRGKTDMQDDVTLLVIRCKKG